MTNEQKAMELLNCEHCMLGGKFCFSEPKTPCGDYEDIIRMAEWKDELFGQVIDAVIKELDKYPDNSAFSKSNIIELFETIKK